MWSICQISKKGIHYSSIQGHLLNSHTSPSPVKLNRVKMNRNSLGLNLKLLMCFIAKIEKALSQVNKYLATDKAGFRKKLISILVLVEQCQVNVVSNM
ncbi:hypothetical protein T02_10298 [Trichinella nativa]|uniref:Uncharacterized protein n=1 Tax=Trichinella nativa TaxID=6335 RepID=A0A0V1LSH1_9BILA|nr:hypothetical protein T02_10298 [Trichinella nativa]